MNTTHRPFVQLAVNAVDLVVLDTEEQYDADHFDRYETFETARDAALTSVEVMLDTGDYDDEEHRQDLDEIREILESALSYEDLVARPGYQRFLESQPLARSAA